MSKKDHFHLKFYPADGGFRNMVEAYDDEGLWWRDTGERNPIPDTHVDGLALRSLFFTIEEAAKLKEQLVKVSRALVITTGFRFCPSCGNYTDTDHAGGCEYGEGVSLAYDITNEAREEELEQKEEEV